MSPDEQTITVPAGFRAVRRSDEFWEKVALGIWEPATVRVLETVLTAGSTHIDVGAWIGPTVLLAATRADHVLAFEPDPVAYAELDRNVALNPDLASRVDLRQEALFDRDNVMRMASNSDRLGDSGATLVHKDVTRRETVNVRTLDARHVVAEPAFAACDLIKIDMVGKAASAADDTGAATPHRCEALDAQILVPAGRQLDGGARFVGAAARWSAPGHRPRTVDGTDPSS